MGDAAPDSEEVREQAANWFARMRRPDAESFRAEFHGWLAAPEHLAACNRIAARFSEAKILRQAADVPPSDPLAKTTGGKSRILVYGAVTSVVLMGCWLAFTSLVPFQGSDSRQMATDATQTAKPGEYITGRGEIRTVLLADGSSVTLDADSLLKVGFTASRRQLRLERGRARFIVAHEQRPFVVSAGEGSVTAHGTEFDVTIDADRTVRVLLLEGVVEVTRPASLAGHPITQRLTAGRAVEYRPRTSRIEAIASAATQPNWPLGLVDFDQATLSQVIEQANRYATLRISLADTRLGALKISGRFHVNDSEKLADNCARLFDLKVDRSVPGELVLRAH